MDALTIFVLFFILCLVYAGSGDERSRSRPPLLPQHQPQYSYTQPQYHQQQWTRPSPETRSQAAPSKPQYVAPKLQKPILQQQYQRAPISPPPSPQQQRPVQGVHKPSLKPLVRVYQPVPPVPQVPRPVSGFPLRQISQQSPQLPQLLSIRHEATPSNENWNDSLDQVDINDTILRKRADQEREAMLRCRKEKRQARTKGQTALFKELSNKALQHKKRSQELYEQASDLVFARNNKDGLLHRVDLHGLTVKEAVTHTTRVLQQAREQGNKEIRFIVGKGLHSKNGDPKIKPAIRNLMEKRGLPVELDPRNAGVLVVKLD